MEITLLPFLPKINCTEYFVDLRIPARRRFVYFHSLATSHRPLHRELPPPTGSGNIENSKTNLDLEKEQIKSSQASNLRPVVQPDELFWAFLSYAMQHYYPEWCS